MNTKPLIRSTTIGLALAALAAPAAGAQQDLRNADQVAPAVVEQQDLRNADQVSPAVVEQQDLRNADQVAPAAHRAAGPARPRCDRRRRRPRADRRRRLRQGPLPAPQDGLDWADAGIGAGGLLGLGLIALGGTLVVVRRRHATHLG